MIPAGASRIRGPWCAALAATLAAGIGATPAGAQGDAASATALAVRVLPDAAAWLAAPGAPGWNSATGYGFFPALPVAGHAWPGFRIEDPERAPEGGPFPGMLAALPSLAAYDSLRVDVAARSGRAAPEQAFAVARPLSDPGSGGGRPLATFAVTSGDFGLDETSLTARRVGATSRLAVESGAWRRGEVGSYGGTGRHRWGALLAQHLGPHEVAGSFRHSGTAARLVSGDEQTARGASGRIGWTWNRVAGPIHLGIERQWDEHRSFGGSFGLPSRRDAQRVRIEAGARLRAGTRSFGAALDGWRDEVRRSGAAVRSDRSGEEWGTIDFRDEGANRRFTVALAGGHLGALDRVELAPSARAEWSGTGRREAVWVARRLASVWHDLAPGEASFLQRTWIAGAEAERAGSWGRVAMTASGGQTRDRALVPQGPLEESWLRQGLRRDPEAWNFVQLTGGGRLDRGRASVGGEGSALLSARADRTPLTGLAGPEQTARLFGELRFDAFGGDLGVRVIVEGEYVGERVVALPGGTPAEFRLDSEIGCNGTLAFALADAWIVLRMNRLQGGTGLDPWWDVTTGSPARGLPREFRLAIVWRLRN